MSQSQPLGIDAARWSGVAAAMADYLRRWLTAPLPPAVPLGTIAGAQRFLHQVLEGAALDRRERIRPEIPVMVGLSNWTIAVGVLARMPEQKARSEEVATVAQRFLDALKRMLEGERDQRLEVDAADMEQFFLELLRQGARRRQSAFAAKELPLG